MKKFMAAGIALLLAGGGLWWWWPFGNGHGTLKLAGIVEIQEVRLGSKVGGRVESVQVEEGALVSAGRPLVIFETPELQAQRDQMKAKLAAAQAELNRLLAGARVEEKKAAQAAADAARARFDLLKQGFRIEEKTQAASDLKFAEADLKLAEEEFQRVYGLYRQRSASKAEFDQAVSARDRSRSRVDTARAKLDLVERGYRKEEIAEARALWEQARAKADEVYEGPRQEDIEAAKARVAETRARLAETESLLKEAVVAVPANLGQVLVEVVSVRPGDLVPANQPVVRVLRAEDLWVKVFVPETKLGLITVNQEVEVTIDSHPDRRFRGKVVQRSAVSEFTPRNVQSVEERRHQVFGVKVRVEDPQGIFNAGMAAQVYVPLK